MTLAQRVIAGFGAEDNEQFTIIQYCDTRNIACFHVPNSTYTKSPMVRMKNFLLGVRPGIPDLFVLLPGIGLIIIELKRKKIKGGSNNYPSKEQRAWIALFNTLPGSQAFVCFGADEAIAVIEKYKPL